MNTLMLGVSEANLIWNTSVEIVERLEWEKIRSKALTWRFKVWVTLTSKQDSGRGASEAPAEESTVTLRRGKERSVLQKGQETKGHTQATIGHCRRILKG